MLKCLFILTYANECLDECQTVYFECYFGCNQDQDCMRHCTYSAEDCYNGKA